MPIIKSSFTPPWWISNPHAQTVLSARFRKVEPPAYIHEEFPIPGPDFIDLEWVLRDCPQTQSLNGGKKLLVLCYGIVASSKSSYILGTIRKFSSQGFDCLVIHPRGVLRPGLLRYSYHPGDYSDLQLIVNHVSKKYQDITLIGFSLGGNLVLKYLGEMGSHVPPEVKKGIAISTPCCLKTTATVLERPINRLYLKDMVKKLRLQMERKINHRPHLFQDIQLDAIQSVHTYVENTVLPIHAYKDLDEYYYRNSCNRFIPSIATPTLILNALDDPFFGKECYPIQECLNHPFVYLEMPSKGGHIGFIENSINGAYYFEQRALDFTNKGIK
jgi:hypothetical protein